MKHCCCCCVCFVNLCYGYFLFSFVNGEHFESFIYSVRLLKQAAQTLTGEHKVLGIVYFSKMEISLAKFIGNHLGIAYM